MFQISVGGGGERKGVCLCVYKKWGYSEIKNLRKGYMKEKKVGKGYTRDKTNIVLHKSIKIF